MVTPGAMLSGTATVPGLLVAGGTLMPGQSVGTINVRGSLAFTSAATYLININAVTASQTNVTGTEPGKKGNCEAMRSPNLQWSHR